MIKKILNLLIKKEKVIEKKEENINANNKVEITSKEFICEIDTREYTSERIQEIVDGYIKDGYFEKDELYDGLDNDEISDITYQLPDTSFACEIERFEDTGKYGVYMVDVNDNNVFIGYIPKERSIEFKKIELFGKDTKGGLVLKGGKYKTYDDKKQKVVTKKENFIPIVNLKYSLEDEDSIDTKIQDILKQEKEFSQKYFVISTYIAGKDYNNADGTSRMENISNLKDNDLLILEKYFYQDEKAVRILTMDKKEIGNVPRDEATTIFDAIVENKIEKVEYKPRWYQGRITDYRIDVTIKK